ncbi:MAG: hypothetical protein HZB68_04655 [Candidatus Aenigmarchaeota archaeon]|nr:hypothetical protein [Candidatus Aenigmarchaeota archaeon]
MGNELVTLGFIAIFAGVVLVMIGSLGSKDVHVGVGGFIGPIPFGFANSPQMLKIIIGITAAFFLINVIMRFVK